MAQMQLPWLTARLDPCESSLQLKPSNRKFPNGQPFQTQARTMGRVCEYIRNHIHLAM